MAKRIKSFSELVLRYHNWQLEVDLDHNINENTKYVWSIPKKALTAWKHELDDEKDRFTTHVLASYQDMFQVGKLLMGLVIACTSVDDYVRLYELSEKTVPWTMEKVLCSKNINILSMNGISRQVNLPNGKTTTLPIVIKPNTLTVSNEEFDLIDNKHSNIGFCLGQEFELGIRKQNRLGKESWFASINYAKGNLHLVRSHTTNEKKFVDYYNYLIQMLGSIGSRTVTTASGASMHFNTISSYPSRSAITPYDYVTISGTAVVLTDPASTMFEFDIYEEIPDENTFDTDTLDKYQTSGDD